VNIAEINNEVGDMDLFLFDLILKGEVERDMRVLDAGCGSGRNLFFFLKQGFDTTGVDIDQSEINASNFLSRGLGRGDVCSQASLSNLPFDDGSFDFVICSRVLHFANSAEEFYKMMFELARVLSPSGLLYLSMDSMVGLENQLKEIDEHKHQFPDGSIRFVLTENRLLEIEKSWVYRISPRTVNFNGQHVETTLILRKG